jgi:hypothetical protein
MVHDFLRVLKKKTMVIISLLSDMDIFSSAFAITKLLVVMEGRWLLDAAPARIHVTQGMKLALVLMA